MYPRNIPFFCCFYALLIVVGYVEAFSQNARIKYYPGPIEVFDLSLNKIKFGDEYNSQNCDQSPQNCLSDIEVYITLYKSEKSGVNTILVRQSDKTQFLDVRVVDMCSENLPYPNRPDSLCLSIGEDRELRIMYRFPISTASENDRYSVIARVTRPNEPDPVIYTSTAQFDFASSSKESKIVVDRDFTLDHYETVNTFFTRDGETKKRDLKLNDRIIIVEIALPKPASEFATDDEKTYYKELALARLRKILSWIKVASKDFQTNPNKLLKIEIDEVGDNLTEYEYPLFGFGFLGYDEYRDDFIVGRDRNDDTSTSELEKKILNDQSIKLYLVGKRPFPNRPFHIKLMFPTEAPLEITQLNERKAITLPGARALSNIATKDVDKTLGLRSFKTNFDIQTNFASSVVDKEENGIQVRSRKYEGTVDMRIAPWINRRLATYKDGDLILSSTPIFVDAKASLGKIEKDTLSTNRTLIGSELSLLFLGSEHQATYTRPFDRNRYKLSFRYLNISDRDFKRAEATFNYETMLYYVRLNNPLSGRSKQDRQVNILEDAPPVFVPTGKFGYQIQPLFGFHIGKRYRDKREVFTIEEQDDFVRRIYVGLDMQFDLTRRFQISIKDTYYLRFGVTGNRNRNHFKTTLETPIGALGRSAVHSAFFSFERGHEPPFVGNGVNALKVGYRISFNFGLDGLVN